MVAVPSLSVVSVDRTNVLVVPSLSVDICLLEAVTGGKDRSCSRTLQNTALKRLAQSLRGRIYHKSSTKRPGTTGALTPKIWILMIFRLSPGLIYYKDKI